VHITAARAGLRSATRVSYKMQRYMWTVQQDGAPSQLPDALRHDLTTSRTVIEPLNMWPRIARAKAVGYTAFWCHLADDVPPTTTHFSRGAPACESVSAVNSRSGLLTTASVSGIADASPSND